MLNYRPEEVVEMFRRRWLYVDPKDVVIDGGCCCILVSNWYFEGECPDSLMADLDDIADDMGAADHWGDPQCETFYCG